MTPHPPSTTLFPYTTLFRSALVELREQLRRLEQPRPRGGELDRERSEEHTSELQSLRHLVCRLLLEIKYQACSSSSGCLQLRFMSTWSDTASRASDPIE